MGADHAWTHPGSSHRASPAGRRSRPRSTRTGSSLPPPLLHVSRRGPQDTHPALAPTGPPSVAGRAPTTPWWGAAVLPAPGGPRPWAVTTQSADSVVPEFAGAKGSSTHWRQPNRPRGRLQAHVPGSIRLGRPPLSVSSSVSIAGRNSGQSLGNASTWPSEEGPWSYGPLRSGS